MLGAMLLTKKASADVGLVLKWGFEEGSGSTFADLSGNGNAGGFYRFGTNLTSSASYWVAGKVGSYAAKYINTNTGVHLNTARTQSAFSYPAAGASTWCYFVKFLESNIGERQLTVATTASASAPFSIGHWSNLEFMIRRNTDGNSVNINTNTNIAGTLNVWKHVACVIDPPNVYGYVDGSVLNGGSPFRTDVNGGIQSVASSYLYWGVGEGSYVTKDVAYDDVRVYSRALSAAEILAIASQ